MHSQSGCRQHGGQHYIALLRSRKGYLAPDGQLLFDIEADKAVICCWDCTVGLGDVLSCCASKIQEQTKRITFSRKSTQCRQN
jgi:hypothetical protein